MLATSAAGSDSSKNGSGSQTSVRSPSPITVAQYGLRPYQFEQLVIDLLVLNDVHEHIGTARTTSF
jgi:hypothetical protein